MTALQTTIDAGSAASSKPQPQTNPVAPAATVSTKTWLAVFGATLGAFMAVLNIQIVNASLADIQGAIGAGIDDGGWISTSYLIAEIIVIPLSGWLAQGLSLVAMVRRRRAPTSVRPWISARSSTSVQAKTVRPANSGLTWRPPLIAAMWKALPRPLKLRQRASEMTWPP